MGCMVFADGAANEPEVAAARGQLATNPVLKNSIGTKRADELFSETVDAVGQIVVYDKANRGGRQVGEPQGYFKSYGGEFADFVAAHTAWNFSFHITVGQCRHRVG